MHTSIFETLADPSRFRIVCALLGGEHAVNDIVLRLDIHQSGVSRHLRILHEAGFVKSRASGQKRLYSLRGEPFREIDAWVAQYRNLWEARLDRFAVALAKKQSADSQSRSAKRKEKLK